MLALAILPLAAVLAVQNAPTAARPTNPAAPAQDGAGSAARPSIEALRAAVEAFYAELNTKFSSAPTSQEEADRMQKEAGAVADAAIDALGVDVATLTTEEAETLGPMIGMSPKARAARAAALEARAKEPSVAGFAAALEVAGLLQSRERFVALLGHPACADGIASGEGAFVLEMAAEAPADALAAHRATIEAMAARFNPDTPFAFAMAGEGYLKLARKALSDTQYQAARAAVIACIEGRLAKSEGREKASLARVLKSVNGAAARGELVGFACPTLTCDWVARADGSAPWKSIDELKGRVVVLDFWATWCGPCVGSFPQVAEMRKHYPESDVEIVGVTSVQGTVAHQKRPRVECKGDVAKERAEVLEFMKDMGVTWTVAMTAEDVFNPDFGIRGIPFVAVLDREGKVHKAGLHPSDEAAIRAAVDECLAKK